MMHMKYILLSALMVTLSGCVSKSRIDYENKIQNITTDERQELLVQPNGYKVHSHVLLGPIVNRQEKLSKGPDSYTYTRNLEALGGVVLSGIRSNEYELDGSQKQSVFRGDILGGVLLDSYTRREGESKEQVVNIFFRCFGGVIYNDCVYGKFLWITFPLKTDS